jgi:hypothetical protein
MNFGNFTIVPMRVLVYPRQDLTTVEKAYNLLLSPLLKRVQG